MFSSQLEIVGARLEAPALSLVPSHFWHPSLWWWNLNHSDKDKSQVPTPVYFTGSVKGRPCCLHLLCTICDGQPPLIKCRLLLIAWGYHNITLANFSKLVLSAFVPMRPASSLVPQELPHDTKLCREVWEKSKVPSKGHDFLTNCDKKFKILLFCECTLRYRILAQLLHIFRQVGLLYCLCWWPWNQGNLFSWCPVYMQMHVPVVLVLLLLSCV